jgi:hypothetical protein
MSSGHTQLLLTILELKDGFNRQQRFAEPDFKLLNPYNVQWSAEEESILKRFIAYVGFHMMIVYKQTMIYSTLNVPPVGYGATCHYETRFRPQIFHNLFFGFAMIKLNYGQFYIDEVKWKKMINFLIYDNSPLPPTKDTIYGEWIPSLGMNGWIGIGHTFDATSNYTVTVYCVAGLDAECYEQMELELREAYRNQKNFGEILGILQPYREIAIENRRRLLYYVSNFFCELPVNTLSIINGENRLAPIIRMKMTKNKINQLMDTYALKNVTDIPAFFMRMVVVGGGGEEDEGDGEVEEEEEQQFEVLPKSVEPDLDVIFDDLVEYPHDPNHVLRYSNCSLMSSGRVVCILNPMHVISIYPTKKEFDTLPWLCCYPSLNASDPMKKITASGMITYLSEEGGIFYEMNYVKNPIIEFPAKEGTIEGCLDFNQLSRLMPKYVRLSKIPYFNHI